MYTEREWWIEVEINPLDNNIFLFDEILEQIYQNFLENQRQNILGWHFFREYNNLRFRIELDDRETRDRISEILNEYLNSIEIINEYYFANHGNRVENLDDGYSGEKEQYGRLWPHQKKIWEWGSEMAIKSYREFKETGNNIPRRGHQLMRIFHLLSNQLFCSFNEDDIIIIDGTWKR